MKKYLSIVMLLILSALIFSACGAGDTPPADNGPSSAESAEFYFETGSHKLRVNDDMKDIIAAIGEPLRYFEAPSCAFEGLDKTYTYAGFVIITRPEGDSDFVSCITLSDDSVTTPEGAYIGFAKADVIKLYGEGDETPGGISYTKGDCVLSFIIDKDTVISIEYLSKD